MSIADWSGTSLPWSAELSILKERLFQVFRRSETREQVGLYLDGLIGGVERKNGWQLAEYAGDEAPWRMQAVLGRGFWDAECARDICRDYIVERLGDASGVLVLDETGFVKKGKHSVGVARQYSGTAGRIENCQIGVFLGYASRKGHALIDRRLYLPQDWAADEERRKKAHVPDDVAFATKPKIGIRMVEAALDASVPCSWVLGDSVYGCDKSLRIMLEARDKPYVLAVRSDEKLMIETSFETRTAEKIAVNLGTQDWQRLPAGQGSKGPRLYDWARVRLLRLQAPPWDHWLLIRRSISDPKDMAFYVTFGPHTTELKELAAVAGLRWTVEECFQSAKGETGLDHCEARSWHGWHRHMTLSMLAFAFLACLRARLLQAKSATESEGASGKANKRSLSAAA
jgi:SRSO17 transposase